jgi:hypothetical protein
MKRFLNKVRVFTVNDSALTGTFQLSSGTPDNNEIIIGKDSSNNVKGLFVHKSGQIYALSYDEFSYSLLYPENNRLNAAFSALTLPTSGTVPVMPDEED